jgi:hypothetical protein
VAPSLPVARAQPCAAASLAAFAPRGLGAAAEGPRPAPDGACAAPATGWLAAPPPPGGHLLAGPACAAPDAVTICQAHPACPMRPPGSRPAEQSRLAGRLDAAPRVPCRLDQPATRRPAALLPIGRKGHKYVNLCAGPWVSAALHMPAAPITSGAKRAAAGLADAVSTRAATRPIEDERAARALVAILP